LGYADLRPTGSRKAVGLVSFDTFGIGFYAITVGSGQIKSIQLSCNFSGLFEFNPDDVYDGGWWLSLIHPADRAAFVEGLLPPPTTGRTSRQYRVLRNPGEYRWVRDEAIEELNNGEERRLLGLFVDISGQHASDEVVYQLSNIDPLSGLPNRRLLSDRLHQALMASHEAGRYGALLCIDIDRFRLINELGGHAAGDAVLAEVSRRFEKVAEGNDTLGRLGGDAFVYLLGPFASNAAEAAFRARVVAKRMLAVLDAEPFKVDSHVFHIGASIGFTVFPKSEGSIESLFTESETAMSYAKAGITKVVMFSDEMKEMAATRHEVELEIRSALAEDRFELWLQDQVDQNGQVIGAEALLRLRTRDDLILMPYDFISVAEATGLIGPIGVWAFKEASRILAQLKKRMLEYRLSVNVSPQQFRDPNFVQHVLDALAQSGAPAQSLTIEITESLLITNTDEAAEAMKTLNEAGISFSIDDFGTGYSSLRYLKQLDIHEIKIDKGFVGQLPSDWVSVAIVEAILSMAHHLGVVVVAEGVETPEHFEFLKERGCQLMQGFLFSKPVPASDWLEARTGIGKVAACLSA